MINQLNVVLARYHRFLGTIPFNYTYRLKWELELTWGVAGRSKQNLKNVLFETAKKIGVDDINSVPIIIADSNDEESITRMTAQAKVIINCCGPYELYGEIVVKCCIETGTHHVDVSVEPVFVEGMELKYRKAAEEKGVYIVSACGVSSTAADLGLVFLEKHFKGTLNSVEIYLHIYEEGGFSPGPVMHYGTWESMINELANLRKFIALKMKHRPVPLPKLQPKLSFRLPFRKEANKWAIGYPVIDSDVILRSQCYFHEQEGKRPVQVRCYGIVNSFINILLLVLLSIIVLIVSQLPFGRKLLLQHPEIFTAGFVSREEPSDEALTKQKFSYTFEGEGWSEKLLEGEDQYITKPNKAIVGRMSGTNPGYGFTCAALALTAIMILTEPEKLPSKGGVYTPAAAFSKTSLMEELQKNEVVLEIISTRDM